VPADAAAAAAAPAAVTAAAARAAAREAAAAMEAATAAAAAMAAMAEHMGTTLLMTQILYPSDNNTTIPIPNTPALHNNSSPYSRCIR
jgi:hypothetical protein